MFSYSIWSNCPNQISECLLGGRIRCNMHAVYVDIEDLAVARADQLKRQ